MITPFSRLLEHSLASIDPRVNPDAGLEAFEQRRVDIQALRHPLKRHGAMAIHRLVGLYPEGSYQLQQRLLRRQGIERLGLGFEALVFLYGEEVLKVYRHTADMDDHERQEFRDNHERSAAVLQAHLPNVAVPHRFGFGTHPLVPAKPVVTATQAFVHYEASDSVFNATAQTVDMARLEALERRHPGAVRSLSDFALRSLDMYETTSYLPDTYGPDNLVIGRLKRQAPSVMLIDTHPHKDYEGHESIYPHIITQLEDLAAADGVL